MDLTQYELDLLRHINGEHVDSISGWGAALEYLSGAKMIKGQVNGDTLTYELTDAGRAAICPTHKHKGDR